MSVNYYESLEIDRNATFEQISYAFKRLSLKFNPTKNPTNQACNAVTFAAICEAWEVLSNPKMKAIFDQYGEYGLKNEFKNEKGETIGGYIFLGNSEEIYDKYFEDEYPLDKERFNEDGSDVHGSFLVNAKILPVPPVPEDVVVNL